MEATDLMSAAEVAELLGVSVATVTRLAETEVLRTAHKMPGRTGARLFARPDVDAYASNRSAA